MHADFDLQAYHDRIGFNGEGATPLARLGALILRHAARIPFEGIDVMLDRPIPIDLPAIADKLVRRQRGGYCFEHNRLFQQVLVLHGFAVEPLIGRVLWMKQPDAPPPAWTHMALRVTIDGVRYLADVGFGGCLATRPLRFDTDAPQPTGHGPFRLVPTDVGHRLEALLGEDWAPVYELIGDTADETILETGNRLVWTDPDTHFRHRLMVALTTPEARITLLDDRLTVRSPEGVVDRTILSPDALRDLLQTRFGLDDGIDWPRLFGRIRFEADMI